MGFTLPVPPSDPPSDPSDPAPDPLTHARALIAKKDALDAALHAQYAVLAAHDATMATPLLDPAGFPRADLDLVALRAARVRVLEIRNDLAKVLDDVKLALERVHASRAQSAHTNADTHLDMDTHMDTDTHTKVELGPFARIDGVAPGSPASSAGLRRDDLLLQFGPLTAPTLPQSPTATATAPSPLAPLASLVAEHENRPLQIKVRRTTPTPTPSVSTDPAPHTQTQTQTLTFSLTPRKGWGGRGLLGCHIVPYSED